MSVPFTQFVRPSGDRRTISIDLEADVEAKANELIEAGCEFEAEAVPPNLVSLECVDYAKLDDDGDPFTFAFELCENGPVVPETVQRLINTAHEQWKKLACTANQNA